jgi:hypothetical protein
MFRPHSEDTRRGGRTCSSLKLVSYDVVFNWQVEKWENLKRIDTVPCIKHTLNKPIIFILFY